MPADQRIWYNKVYRDAWWERNCRVCFHPEASARRMAGQEPACSIMDKADDPERKTPPKEFAVRRTGGVGETYTCKAFMDKPKTVKRGSAPADTPSMFGNIEEQDYRLVPVEGWEDYRAKQKKDKEGDHQ